MMTKPYEYDRKIVKVGHSFMVSLPSIWCKANQIRRVDVVTLEVFDDKIVIRVKRKKSG